MTSKEFEHILIARMPAEPNKAKMDVTPFTYRIKKRKSDFILGYICWLENSNQYCFEPLAGDVIDYACMVEIVSFIQGLES